MKKAIFLVEDFNKYGPSTMVEKVIDVPSYIDKKVGYHEVTDMLYHCPTDWITFKKSSEFINEVKASSFPTNYLVYYYIQSFFHMADMTPFFLFALDPCVRNFLIEYNIPIIIDSTNESNNTFYHALDFFNSLNKLSYKNTNSIRDLLKLKYYIVGGEYNKEINSNGLSNKLTNSADIRHLYHCNKEINELDICYANFPSPFFFQVCPGTKNYAIAQENFENFKSKIKNFKVTDSMPTWKAFVNRPRLSRILFEIYAHHYDIFSQGIFKSSENRKNIFLEFYQKEKHRLPNFSNDIIDSLNTDYRNFYHNYGFDIDPLYHDNYQMKRSGNGVPYIKDTLMFVALETNWIGDSIAVNNDIFYQYQSSATEKISVAILSGDPVITCGGYNTKQLFDRFGFHEYENLELPDDKFYCYTDELIYVIEKIKNLCLLTTEQKQHQWNRWSDSVIYNYQQFLNTDIKYHYLKALNSAMPIK